MADQRIARERLIEMLQSDLKNEYKHLHFYMRAGVMIQGPHRQELGEYLLEEAASELKHCEEFARKIIGLGGIPTAEITYYPLELTSAHDILEAVYLMEKEVVANFAWRLLLIDTMLTCDPNLIMEAPVDLYAISLFYEDQLQDSRKSVEHVQEMLKEM